MMNDLFRDLINCDIVMIYLDDILIFTKMLEEHYQIIWEVLQILWENHLYLKDEKCKFEKCQTEYLEMIISEGTVKIDSIKVARVKTWPQASNKYDVQAFLRFTNFYHQFIKDYREIAKSLTILTSKLNWQWEDEQKQIFKNLKSWLVTAPILAIPTDDDFF